MRLELKLLNRSETCILNGNGYKTKGENLAFSPYYLRYYPDKASNICREGNVNLNHKPTKTNIKNHELTSILTHSRTLFYLF